LTWGRFDWKAIKGTSAWKLSEELHSLGKAENQKKNS
jgi:hypothetical protein